MSLIWPYEYAILAVWTVLGIVIYLGVCSYQASHPLLPHC